MKQMNDIPDKSLFSVNERDGEYTARISIRGTISMPIKAASKAEAEAKARAEVDKLWDDGFVEVDDIDQMEVSWVTKDPPMYRVTRDGKSMQVSHLDPGDTPRVPDERGF